MSICIWKNKTPKGKLNSFATRLVANSEDYYKILKFVRITEHHFRIPFEANTCGCLNITMNLSFYFIPICIRTFLEVPAIRPESWRRYRSLLLLQVLNRQMWGVWILIVRLFIFAFHSSLEIVPSIAVFMTYISFSSGSCFYYTRADFVCTRVNTFTSSLAIAIAYCLC